MATNNFINMVGVLLASVSLWLCSDLLDMRADRIYVVFGLVTLVSSIYVLWIGPSFLIRFTLWLLTHTLYRIKIEGQENVPSRGPRFSSAITSRSSTASWSAPVCSASSASWSIGRTTSARCSTGS